MEPWRRLYEALREALDGPLRRWASSRLEDAFIGYTRTYVELEEGWCGTSLTPRWLAPDPRSMPPLDPSAETPRSLARLVDRLHTPLAAALAVAAVNAATAAWIASTPGSVSTRLTPVDPIPQGKRIVMLGYMPGLARLAAAKAARLDIVEADPKLVEEARGRGYTVHSHTDPGAWKALERAEALIATGSAVLDPPTLSEQLEAARAAEPRILVGATSSFHPLVARKLGFTHVAGSYVDPRLCPRLRAHVAAGRGMHGVKGRVVQWLWPPG